ncbi:MULTISPECIES: alpha-L-fucosidase [Chitinophagaceae]
MRLMKMAICLMILCVVVPCHGQQTNDKMQWWRDAKFGLFLHWGLYSATAGDWEGHSTSRGEQFMMVERIPVETYAHIADTFNPVQFNADQWVLMAKKAGMKYIVITSKHHDGFAMYHSKVSNYNIVERTPYAHDPMADIVKACRRYGIKFGFYYSLGRDWEDPDAATNWPTKGGRSNTWDFPNEDAKDVAKYFRRKVMPQVKELLTQYGHIDILWFDTPELISKSESKALLDTIQRYQPNCIVNSRIGNGYGDYSVYEQSIVSKVLTKPWESCVTISANWAYNKHDSAWKSSNVLVRQLTDIVSKGGNYLLNLSPMGDGEFRKEAVVRVDSVGEWLRYNGDAVYGTRPWRIFSEIDSAKLVPQMANTLSAEEKDALDAVNDRTSKDLFPAIYFTQKSGVVYAIVCNPLGKNIKIKSLSSSVFPGIHAVTLLGHKERKITFLQRKDGLAFSIPTNTDNQIPVYVVKIN